MKATELLEKQHRKVEGLFEKIESGKGDKRALVQELAQNLVAHMVIEQEIFYPAVKQVKEDLVLESFEEHAIARFALVRLVKTEADDVSFSARVTALKEIIEHHVEEEEEELFPQVEKAMGDRLLALGERMKARFEEALEEGYEGALVEARRASVAKANRARQAVTNGRR